MNCRQAATLIDKYLDRRLTDDMKFEFEKHIELCEKCKGILYEEEELYYYINSQPENVPENKIVASDVMNRIYKLQQSHSGGGEDAGKKMDVFFRRMGFSMLLAAFIMICSFFLPAGKANIFDRLVHAETDKAAIRQPYLHNALDRLDNKVKTFVESINLDFWTD